MSKSDYYTGVIDAIMEIETPFIGEEYEYDIKVNDNGWCVSFSWITGYTPAKFKGDWLQPPDDDEPIYDFKKLSFKFNTPLKEVVDEVTSFLTK